MKRKTIATEMAPAAVGPYSQAIQFGNLIFTSGQLPIDIKTGDLVVDDIERATRLCLDNVSEILKEAGSSLDDVIKVLVFVDDIENFEAINKVYAEYFVDNKPARSLVEVVAIPKGAKIEIEVIAAVK